MMLFMSITTLSFAQCDMYLTTRKAKSALPKRVLNVVSRADSVIAYQVDAMNAPSDTSETICGFAVVGKPFAVGKRGMASLQSIVDSLAYSGSRDDIQKLSTFIPDYGFDFYKGKTSVAVLFDLHADLCTFYYKRKQYLLNTDSVKTRLSGLLNSVWKRTPAKQQKAENFVPQVPTIDVNKLVDATKQLKAENDTTPKTPKYIKLNGTILKMIKSAKNMTCCIIDPLAKGDKDMEKLGRYVVLQKKDFSDERTIKAVKDVIAGNKSFEELEYVKNCTFLPDIAFQIRSGKNTLNILFSFYCSECMMQLDGKQVFRNDCSLIQSEIIGIARQIYPKDKYLRTISKQ